ncbi:MAG: chromosome partitioning protein ParA [Burkholderia sp.]|nr:chromosome partitioning protein ParA [Burkholderia sp.]
MFDGPTLADPQIVGNGDVRQVAYGSDHGLFVEFRMENVHMAFLSEEQGRPVYEQKPFIRMYIPGDKTKVVDREVRLEPFADIPADPQRFPRQWEAFKSGVAAVQSGTPLVEWPMMTSSQVKELNALNIYTVEALSEISDVALGGLGHGGRNLRDQAKAWLSRLNDDASTMKLAAQNAELQRQIDELRASVEKRGPGRPKAE